jgi:uncharacterized membrane protein (UPF0127 family)
MRSVVLQARVGLPLTCLLAERRRDRRRGLRAPGLPSDAAMLFPNATSVHTFGMDRTIVVARLDAGMRVLDVRRVPPRRWVPPTRRARHVLECDAEVDLPIGEVLRIDGPVPAQPSSSRTSV